MTSKLAGAAAQKQRHCMHSQLLHLIPREKLGATAMATEHVGILVLQHPFQHVLGRLHPSDPLPLPVVLEGLVQPGLGLRQVAVRVDHIENIVTGHTHCHNTCTVSGVGLPERVKERKGGDPGSRLLAVSQAWKALPRKRLDVAALPSAWKACCRPTTSRS